MQRLKVCSRSALSIWSPRAGASVIEPDNNTIPQSPVPFLAAVRTEPQRPCAAAGGMGTPERCSRFQSGRR